GQLVKTKSATQTRPLRSRSPTFLPRSSVSSNEASGSLSEGGRGASFARARPMAASAMTATKSAQNQRLPTSAATRPSSPFPWSGGAASMALGTLGASARPVKHGSRGRTDHMVEQRIDDDPGDRDVEPDGERDLRDLPVLREALVARQVERP